MSGPQYSPRRRTALVLAGSGTAGAYHAGVLRALHEAGVRIDLVAGQGMGAASAMLAAIDGAAKLWEPDGLWRGPHPPRFYRLRGTLRAAGWLIGLALVCLLLPFGLLVAAMPVYVLGLLLNLVGLENAGITLTGGSTRLLDRLFAPDALPTVMPRLVVLALLAGIVTLAIGTRRAMRGGPERRAQRGWTGLLSAPLTARGALARIRLTLWDLIRGAAPIAMPADTELGQRYAELLGDNLGQPGFRELLIVAHDLDARADVLFALLAGPHRKAFFGGRAAKEIDRRRAETVDLAGAGRDHVFDALAAALSIPVVTDPSLVTFARESHWRGETHRLCDRPDALRRLVDEAATAGAEQIILAAPAPPPAGPHEIAVARGDLRGRAGEYLVSLETAALGDASRTAPIVFVIRPPHNPIGPFDFEGAYDERSDRRSALAELIDRGYEDAYRQFIEPRVAAGIS
jgi:Patatin-like phospholipase